MITSVQGYWIVRGRNTHANDPHCAIPKMMLLHIDHTSPIVDCNSEEGNNEWFNVFSTGIEQFNVKL